MSTKVKALIGALVLSVTMFTSALGADTNRTPAEEFEAAVAFTNVMDDAVLEGYKQWQEDPLSSPQMEKVLMDYLVGMESFEIDDCFAEWWATKYSSVLIFAYVIIDVMRQGERPEHSYVLNGAVMLDSLADNEAMTVAC